MRQVEINKVQHRSRFAAFFPTSHCAIVIVLLQCEIHIADGSIESFLVMSLALRLVHTNTNTNTKLYEMPLCFFFVVSPDFPHIFRLFLLHWSVHRERSQKVRTHLLLKTTMLPNVKCCKNVRLLLDKFEMQFFTMPYR